MRGAHLRFFLYSAMCVIQEMRFHATWHPGKSCIACHTLVVVEWVFAVVSLLAPCQCCGKGVCLPAVGDGVLWCRLCY